jgi:ElaB/YqjD/DUF883 family membrane-anchored ribosome-binding protein
MVDQGIGTREGGSASSNDTLRGLSQQAVAAGRDLKAKAGEFAGSSADKLKDQASNLADNAKDVAEQAGEKLKEAVTERKVAGADYVGDLAETIRRAGRELDNDLPIAGKYIRKAASHVDNVAESIRTGDFNDLMKTAQSFARRQPTAFLGLAALAGFAAVRFFKSSSSSSEVDRSSSNAGANQAGYRDEFRN